MYRNIVIKIKSCYFSDILNNKIFVYLILNNANIYILLYNFLVNYQSRIIYIKLDIKM